MKCFAHRTADAVGICRACQKGLCAGCAVDHGHALSCRGACESEVAFIRKQTLTSRKLLAAQRRNRYLAPAFFGVIGLLFIGHDALEGGPSLFESGLGALLILFAVAVYLANRRWAKEGPSDGA